MSHATLTLRRADITPIFDDYFIDAAAITATPLISAIDTPAPPGCAFALRQPQLIFFLSADFLHITATPTLPHCFITLRHIRRMSPLRLH
jgi:hypothetical protein